MFWEKISIRTVGLSEQANTVGLINGSISIIAQQTSQNAANAIEADQLSLIAKSDAARGNEQMSELMAAMEEIKHSSDVIAKIFHVIEDIISAALCFQLKGVFNK